jgi:germination protein M
VAEPPGGPIVAMPTPETGGPATTVVLYTLKHDENGTTLTPRQVAVDDTLSDVDRAKQAIEAMAAEKESPLPKGTKVLSITFASDLATVDLSPEFKSNFEGGDRAELLAINAVTATLGQFPRIKRVQVKIGGEIVDSLGGAQSIAEPLPDGQAKG